MYSRLGAGYFNNMLTRLFEAAGALPEYVQHVTQIHSMLGLVQAGLAAAIVPASAIDLHMDAIQFRKFTTQPTQPVELHMVVASDNGNPALQPMLNLCAEIRQRRRQRVSASRGTSAWAHLHSVACSVASAPRTPGAVRCRTRSYLYRCARSPSIADSMRCSA